MKRFLLTAATFACLAGGAFAAGPLGGAVPVTMPYSGDSLPSVGAEGKYGLLPFLRRGIFWRHNAGGCPGCDGGPRLAGSYGPTVPGAGIPGVPQPGQPGMGMPGTLVFPTHPFMRSPRDFFMTEK